MKRLNKKSHIILFAILAFITTTLTLIIDKYDSKDAYWPKTIVITVGIIGNLIVLLDALGDNFAFVRSARHFLTSRLPFLSKKEAISTRNMHQLKRKLYPAVQHICKQIVDNEIISRIEQQQTTSTGNYHIKTLQSFYEDLESLDNGVKSQFAKDMDDIEAEDFALAVLGEPGNGKTYNLAMRVLDHIARIKAGDDGKGKLEKKIPVFIQLYSWDNKKTFADWMADKILTQYREYKFRRQDLLKMIEKGQVIPYLDGLDEVDTAYRRGCLFEIMKYASENSVVFTCRREDFKFIRGQMLPEEMQGDIRVLELQPLKSEMVSNIIRNTKSNAEEMLLFLEKGENLYHHINTPLTLNLFLLTFDNLKRTKGVENMDKPGFEKELWGAYDNLMFEEKFAKKEVLNDKNERTKKSGTPQEIRTYLIILANRISAAFFIEQLQPSWLKRPSRIALYYLTSRVISGLFMAVAIGLFIATQWALIGNGIMASIVAALLTMYLNSKENEKTFINKISPPVLYTFVLVIVTGIYQGFSVPRLGKDIYGYFSITESLSGVLLGLFFGAIFGFRKTRQSREEDIRPVEKVHLSFRGALLDGLKGGLGMGTFTGAAGILIKFFFTNTTFANWLDETTQYGAHYFDRFSSLTEVQKQYLFLLILGFSIGFLIGGMIFAIMAGRKKDDEYFKNKEKNIEDLSKHHESLNYGIRESLWNSLKFGFLAFILLTLTYSAFIILFNRHPASLIRAVMIGVGTGIIVFLWYGGFEVIQHWTLRLYLHLYGIAPLKYSRWVRDIRELAFVRKVGAGLQFYHDGLKNYFSSISLSDDTRAADTRKTPQARIAITCISLFTAITIAWPFYSRSANHYWQNNEVHINFKPCKGVLPLSQSAVYIDTTGMLCLHADGRVNIGTFSGYVGAEGTETGLLGFSITDVYDVWKEYPHGALMYCIKPNNSTGKDWCCVYNCNRLYKPTEKRVDSLWVNKGDTLFFSLNDREWQNNSGSFVLSMTMSPTDNNETKTHMH